MMMLSVLFITKHYRTHILNRKYYCNRFVIETKLVHSQNFLLMFTVSF